MKNIEEKLNLVIISNRIHAGAKMYKNIRGWLISLFFYVF
mgnify:CR=1 FL=1